LFHDLCKTQEFWINRTGDVQESDVQGHTKASLGLMDKLGITGLSPLVRTAILYHMGHWDKSLGDEYLDKYQSHPIIGLTHIVATMTTFWT